MADYLERLRSELDSIYSLGQILKSSAKELYPSECKKLEKLNIYGDGRSNFTMFEVLLFRCVETGIDKGDPRVLALLLKIFESVHQAELEGNDKYTAMVDAIANISPSRNINNFNSKIKIPAKSGFKGEISYDV